MKVMIHLLAVGKQDSQSIYALNIVPSIVNNNTKDTFVIFCSSEMQKKLLPLVSSHVSFRVYDIPQAWFLKIIFINTIIPFFFLLGSFNLIYNPTTLFPIVLVRRSVVTIHDLAYRFFSKEESCMTYFVMRFMYWAAQFSYKIIAISESVKKDIVALYHTPETKVVVAYNALPVHSDFEEGYLKTFEIPKETYIVYVGMYRYRKNIEKLVESMKFLPNIKLVCVGSIVNQKKRLINKNGIHLTEDRIIFSGVVSPQLKKNIIQNARVLVFPSVYEGFGFPILEAQELGVPVACSNISVFNEIGQDSVVFFNPHDEWEIAQAIKKLLEYGEERDRVIQKGKQNVIRFNWDNTGKTISQIFV